MFAKASSLVSDVNEGSVQTLIDQESHSTGETIFGHATWLVLRPRAQDGAPPTRKCLGVHWCQLDPFTTEGRIAFKNLFHGRILGQHIGDRMDRNPCPSQ